jgi:hypothetical protein
LAFDSVRWNGERNDDAGGHDCGFHRQSAKHNCPSGNYNTAMLTHNPLRHKCAAVLVTNGTPLASAPAFLLHRGGDDLLRSPSAM